MAENGPKALYRRGPGGDVLWSNALGERDRGPKPVGARVRCIGDSGELGIPVACFGQVAIVLTQEDASWDGQLVDFGGALGRHIVDPSDLMLIAVSAMIEVPKNNIEAITQQQQLEQWVIGNSVHRYDGTLDGQCCPDFSCCMPELKASDEARAEFARAVREHEVDTREGMLGVFRGLMMEAVCGSIFGKKT